MSFLTILLPYSVLDETFPTSRAPGIPGMPVEAWKGSWLGPFKLSVFPLGNRGFAFFANLHTVPILVRSLPYWLRFHKWAETHEK